MNKSKKISIILLTIIIFIGSLSVAFAEIDLGTSVSGRVLMISAYSPGYETFYGQVDGIRAAFEGHDIQFDLEFMDTKRFYEQENVDFFYDYLVFKLTHLEPYDVIIAADDNALDFVIKHKEDLFPSQPVVFLGINNVQKGIEVGEKPDFTGVLEEPTIRETIDLAQMLRPNANRVVFITDETNTALSVEKRYKNQAYHYPDLKFDELSLGEMTFHEMDVALTELTESDIVLLSSALRDKTNASITFKDSLKRILESCNEPIFHLYEFGLGDGIIGGHMVTYFTQGEEAAKVVVRILGGEPVSEIPLVENANRFMIDHDVLLSHGIDENLAPEDTIWINREISIWEEYYRVIIGVIAVLVIQLVFIMFLQRNIRQRKAVEKELIESRNKIQSSNDELQQINEELRESNQELEASYEEIESQRERIYDLIYIDPLTNLRNRHGITEEITEIISSDNEGEKMAVMFLDVDNFKDINDTFGHDVGDIAIRETGNRLRRIQSEWVDIGRFGGDEFLIFIKGNDHVDQLKEIIADIQRCFSELILVDDKSFFLTVSVGVAIYPDHGSNKKELIKRADMALYEAKLSGKNKYVVYEKHMDKALEDKVLFQTLVREGYENDEFYLNYQPYYDCKSESISGFEALIRWHNETLGQVSPYHLVTTAEEMGLIIDIGKWVFREACKFAKSINEDSDKTYLVSINVSAVQIVKVDFYASAVQIVEELGVKPEWICLEMTETVLLEAFKQTKDQIHKLKDYGFMLALDDFGTGYSSLSYFKNIPADILKIDKSFVDHMVTDAYDQYTVEAIINLAHFNQLSVTAEGVEDKDQAKLLGSMTCDSIQGYFYSKSLSEVAAKKLVGKK